MRGVQVTEGFPSATRAEHLLLDQCVKEPLAGLGGYTLSYVSLDSGGVPSQMHHEWLGPSESSV